MEFAGTKVNKTDSEANAIQAIIWETASLEDHIHYMAIKKEKNLLETNGRYNPFPYTPVNWAGVRAYLNSYNSMLAESPYFEIVIDVGMEKNVDPRLLFSIVGQEQSFVRKGSVSARRIINNPYNVYVSWKDYNTNLRDSTEIAANTIRNIMAEAPFELHPVKALNQVYAEDPRWWIGVDYFYSEMVQLGEI
jgi:putative ABC transport system permease protein